MSLKSRIHDIIRTKGINGVDEIMKEFKQTVKEQMREQIKKQNTELYKETITYAAKNDELKHQISELRKNLQKRHSEKDKWKNKSQQSFEEGYKQGLIDALQDEDLTKLRSSDHVQSNKTKIKIRR